MATTVVSIKLDTLKLDNLRRNLEPRANKVLQVAARHIEGGAKRRVRVDTGALRNSIGARQSGRLQWTISDGVEYGIDVEYGTKPHEIRAKPGKMLAFSPIVGRTLTGKALYRRTKFTAKKAEAIGGPVAYRFQTFNKKTGQWRTLKKPRAMYRTQAKGVTTNSGKGALVFRKKVFHPGTKPHPWLVPAVEAERGPLTRAWGELLRV